MFLSPIASPAQSFATLATFNGANGANPYASLIQGLDGNFYGTTYFGGPTNLQCGGEGTGCGTVFKITSSGTLTTLYKFCSDGDCLDGSLPAAPLVQGTDGNFYGTTSTGGDYGGGTTFMITPSGVFTSLHSFTGPDGYDAEGGLLQAPDGNFYGTTAAGGAQGFGTVFRMSTAWHHYHPLQFLRTEWLRRRLKARVRADTSH